MFVLSAVDGQVLPRKYIIVQSKVLLDSFSASFCFPSMPTNHIYQQTVCVSVSSVSLWLLITSLCPDLSCPCLPVTQQAARWLLHVFLNSLLYFSKRCGVYRLEMNCLVLRFLAPVLSQDWKFQTIKSSKETFMVADWANGDNNDVMAGDIITVCQPAEQKRTLPGSYSCLGSRRKREGETKDWCIHSAPSLILPLYSHI